MATLIGGAGSGRTVHETVADAFALDQFDLLTTYKENKND